MSDCRAIANVQQPEQRYHHPQLSPKDMRGSCVRVPQRPIVTHCHPLENQKGPFLPYFCLFLPASLRWGRKWHLTWRGWETLRPNLLGKMENWIELLNFKFKGLGSGLSPIGTWIHSSPSVSLVFFICKIWLLGWMISMTSYLLYLWAYDSDDFERESQFFLLLYGALFVFWSVLPIVTGPWSQFR